MILTQGSGRLYKESLGGFFQFKLNCGPLNLFSKRLHLISYANAPSECLTSTGEQRLPYSHLSKALGFFFFFFFLLQIWLIVIDFPAGKSFRSLERAGFVFFSKENQCRWFCLETQEGGKKEGGEVLRCLPSRGAQRKLSRDQMPCVCTHAPAAQHVHKHLSTPTGPYM